MRPPKYYTPENCAKLIAEIEQASDAMKELFICPKSKKESKFLTPELLETYEELFLTCKNLSFIYDYYTKAGFYKAENEMELAEVAAKLISQTMIENGLNPLEAYSLVQGMVRK